MDVNFIRGMYDYNRWANDRVLRAALPVSSEEFTRELGSSFSSLRDTLVHVLGAEWIWLERWKGNSPKTLLPPEDFPGVESISTKLHKIEEERSEFICSLSDAQLEIQITYTNLKGQQFTYALGQQMIHVVNHSSYHRGQATTLLRQLNASVLSTDLLLYYDETGR